jgi:hypothetical protein
VVEAGTVLGVLAAVLLLIAAIAWVRLVRGPLPQITNGDTRLDPADGEFASELLFWAAGLSTLAMLVAIAGLIFA